MRDGDWREGAPFRIIIVGGNGGRCTTNGRIVTEAISISMSDATHNCMTEWGCAEC